MNLDCRGPAGAGNVFRIGGARLEKVNNFCYLGGRSPPEGWAFPVT